jgi:hypothetical protein
MRSLRRTSATRPSKRLEEALRKLGLTPRLMREQAERWQERESRRAARALEKDEALEEVCRPVPRYSRTRRP